MRIRGGVALAGLAVASAACGGNGLRLTPIDASVQRPSNIAVYFTVETAEGEPVPGLEAKDFEIYEDGRPVSVLESKQTILNQEVAAEHFTLLLIDMSGSVSESDDVPVIDSASQSFAAKVEKYQKVAVYAFDGERRIHTITNFGTGATLRAGISRLTRFRARDPSTNLFGAVVQAIDVLEKRIKRSRTPLAFGTLVIFTDGTDRASRVSREELLEAIDRTEVDIFAIGVGEEIDEGELSAIGRDGTIMSRDRAAITASFEEAAARVAASSRKYYLLGYCSPARQGTHDVTIATTWDGKRGELTYQFDARGFRPNCDPTKKPSFNLQRAGR
jgi:uncharacterized protein YegL